MTRRHEGTWLRWLLAASAGTLLPACPLSDHYYIDSSTQDADSGHSGGSTTIRSATGGSPDASAGGTTTVDGGAGDSGLAACDSTNCSGTCCDDICADLTTDPSHCGNCTTACTNGQACAAGACAGGWTAIAPAPAAFVARERAAYVGFDDKLFIFGGADAAGNSLGDAAIYDPLLNRWKLVSIDANAPGPTRLATAVWTGTWIVVFGGRVAATGAGLTDAFAYDPVTDTWTRLQNSGIGRTAPIGVSDGNYAAFWGQWAATSDLIAGVERYDMGGNAWQPASSTGDPGTIDNPAWAFDGASLYLFGGRLGGTTKSNQLRAYQLATNSWGTSNTASQLTARWGSFAAWDGLAVFVWGGRDELAARNDGQYLYNGAWTTISVTGAPSARWAPYRQSGWGFCRGHGDLVVMGGQDFAGNFLKDGGRYLTFLASGTPGWTAIPAWKSGDEHQWAATAFVGGAVVVWGGRTGTNLTATGDRWAP